MKRTAPRLREAEPSREQFVVVIKRQGQPDDDAQAQHNADGGAAAGCAPDDAVSGNANPDPATAGVELRYTETGRFETAAFLVLKQGCLVETLIHF